MRWIGLTGGIASGKSTVSLYLIDKGLAVIDADLLAREAVAPGTDGHREVVAKFGASAITKNGDLNRKFIGEIVFGNREKLADLEAIIHPRVRELVASKKAFFESEGRGLAFYDVPLLFEKNMRSMFEKVMLVTCAPDMQIARLMKRDGLTRNEALARINAQMPLSEKIPLSDIVIENKGSLSDLRSAVDRALTRL